MLIVFAAFVLQPAILYLYLVAGLGLPFSSWVVILLWTEIARFMGAPLSQQEIFIITAFGGMVGAFGGLGGELAALPMRFVTPLYNMYIGTTIYAKVFNLNIPHWFAPPPDIAQTIYYSRWVFADPAWSWPILILVASTIFAATASISLGYIAYSIYVREQKLEFPMATAEVTTITALSQREPKRIRALMLAATLGMLFSFIADFLPFFLNVVISGGVPLGFGSPDYDFTTNLAGVLPGASFSFTTDLFIYVAGFLIPVNVAILQFIGAISYYFIGTHLMTRFMLWPEETMPETITSWTSLTIISRSQLYFYVSISLGLGLACIIAPLIVRSKMVVRAFKGLGSLKAEEGGAAINIYVLLALFLLPSFGSVLLVLYLVPGFIPYSWMLLVFTILWSLFATLLSTQAAGITVGGLSIPYQNEFLIYASGYRGQDIWFAPYQIYMGAGIATSLKQADMLGVRHSEYIKAFILTIGLSMVSGFIFTSLFWYIQPFPSGAYPATILTWPVGAQEFCRRISWIWSGYLFRYDSITISFIAGIAIYAVSDLVFHAPYVLISFLAGTLTGRGISWSLAMLIGSLTSRKIIAPRLGEAWGTYRRLVVVGLGLGSAFMRMVAMAVWLIMKSTWLLPF